MSLLYLNGQPIQSGHTITIYRYEPFDYAFTWASTAIATRTTSTLVQSLVSGAETVGSEIYTWFTSPGYPKYPGPRLPVPQTNYGGYTGALSDNEQIVFTFLTPTTATYTINVMIKAGRFVVPLLTTPSYTLYKNESIANTFGSNIRFQAPGNLKVTAPFVVPSLPPGIGFVPVGSSPTLYWDLVGTPPAQTPSNSYIVYAQGSGDFSSRVISKTITLSIEAERIVPFVTPSSNVSMTVGTAITPVVLTSRYPNQFSGNLVYAWSFLPDGLQFLDVNSNAVSSPFAPLDASSTIILAGTPTVAAAQYFRTLGVSSVTTNISAVRQTSPNITVTQPLALTFGETVLFDTTVVPTLYAGVTLDTCANVFRANTYFPFSAGVTSITAGSLPTGLSLVHTPGDPNAYLSGTPTAAGSGTYVLTATNSNGKTRDLGVPITVTPDTISFSGTPADACYNFVISRPLESSLAGYYPANISYTATAASGANVTFSITNAPPGVTATTSGSTLTLGGIPDAITALSTAVITATAPFTGAINTRDLSYAVLTDDVTITNPTSQLNFFQNRAITPVQFTATTLSGRPIISWSSPNLPAGLTISTTGLLTGTPATETSSPQTFDVAASTGYVSETNSFTYNTIQDDGLIVLINNPTQVSDTFSAEIRAVSYSGNAISPTVSNLSPSQVPPITVGVSGNSIVGDFTPANAVLPEYRFQLIGNLGTATAQEVFSLAVQNPSTQRRFVLDTSLTALPNFVPPNSNFMRGAATLYKNESSLFSFPNVGALTTITTPPSNWTQALVVEGVYGQVADVAQSADTCVLTAGAAMYRSSDNGTTWNAVASSNITSIPGIVGDYCNIPMYGTFTTPGPLLGALASDGSLNWLAIGNGYDASSAFAPRTILRTSSNDGVAWTDASLSGLTNINGLFYNRGRYFIAQTNATNPTYRLEASNVSSWTGSAGGMPTFSGNEAYAFAFSNTTVLVGGKGTTPLYKSTDNGTTWSGLTVGASTSIVDIRQAGGYWYLATDDGLYSSSNATTFTLVTPKKTTGRKLDYDGAVFNMLYADSPPAAQMLTAAVGANAVTSATDMLTVTTKRMMTRIIDNGPVNALLSLSASNAMFVAPTVTDYSFYQFVGVNIPVELSPSSNFIYYYGDLPQGLTLALDASGIRADISGIPTLYTGEYQTSYVFARDPATNTTATLPIRNRVILPFVMKKQAGASDYTALLRQYVTVNGAQAARDSVALPVQERNLGEFTAPDAPSVITRTVDPKCFSTSNCT
jgi:hypothetical protein